MSDVLDVLLAGTARNINREPPEKTYRVLRLSQELGQPVEFRLRALTYNRAAELGRMGADMDVMTVLSGVIDPNFKDTRLAVKLGLLSEGEDWGAHGVTPADAIRSILLPGEIAELAIAIEKLSGYRRAMLKEVKKN